MKQYMTSSSKALFHIFRLRKLLLVAFSFREKDLKLPGRGTFADLQAAIRVDKPINLAWFLSKWEYFSSAIVWVQKPER